VSAQRFSYDWRVADVPGRLVHLIALAATALCLLAAPARAQDLAGAKAVLEDPTGRLTFEEARQREFQPYRAFLNKGYTSSVFWVRVTIRPTTAAADQPEPGAGWAIVRMRPAFIDQIELFDPIDTTGRRRLAGDQHEWSASEHPSLTHTFVIPVGAVSRQIWLRVQTSSAKQLHLQILPWKSAAETDRQDELRSALLLMLLVALAVVGIAAAVATHTPTAYAFAAMQIANLPYAMYVLGYLRPMTADVIPAPVLDLAFSLAVFVAVHMACWFYYFFVLEHRPTRLGRLLVTAPLFILPALLLLMMAGQLELALHVNAYAILILPATTLVASLTCTAWRPDSGVRPTLPRWLYLGASIVSVLGAVLWFVGVYGWIKSTYVLLYGMIWFTALIGIVMLTVLLVRTRRTSAMRAEAMLRAQIAESRAAQAAQQRAEQVQLLATLTHEVKTALSVIRIAVTSPSAGTELRAVAEQAIDNIGRTIERCTDVQRVTEPEMFAITSTAVGPLLEAVRAATPTPARVVVSVEHDLDGVLTDGVTLRRLLTLLVENALMHGAQDTPVDLTAAVDRRQAGGVLLWTSNLPGVSGWPDPAQVFAKYYRSPGARRLKGSGLGLHLAATLAQQLGGDLRYAPTATHVRFVLWLPR
jgi:signal transduction histidine kinase